MKSKESLPRRDKKTIETALKRYLKGLRAPAGLRQAMRYAVFSGGKRLRPILTIESSRALNGDIKDALPFACAVELIHNFSLVHDDLPAMDNDDLRRGRPTCHRKFGEGIAILAGDALLNLAFGILAESKSEKSLKAISLMSVAVGAENMIGGQALDITRKAESNDKINSMKTASLMALSCELGALAARGGTRETRILREFGKNLGLAFQLADDINDAGHNGSAFIKMSEKARFFISKAKKEISPFGKKADALRFIADSILKK